MEKRKRGGQPLEIPTVRDVFYIPEDLHAKIPRGKQKSKFVNEAIREKLEKLEK